MAKPTMAMDEMPESLSPRFVGRAFTRDAMPADLAQRFAEMTIKELVVQSLLDHFRTGGTATQIRDFIRDAYGRPIPPSSLRPQMQRLKADNKLEHDPSTDTWNLTKAARVGYRLYDHPTSRKAMKELMDEAEEPALASVLEPEEEEEPDVVIEEEPKK